MEGIGTGAIRAAADFSSFGGLGGAVTTGVLAVALSFRAVVRYQSGSFNGSGLRGGSAWIGARTTRLAGTSALACSVLFHGSTLPHDSRQSLGLAGSATVLTIVVAGAAGLLGSGAETTALGGGFGLKIRPISDWRG